MKTLTKEQQEHIHSGGVCGKIGGFLGGVGIGVAVLTYFGIITVATGGTAGLVLAIAGGAAGLYCESPILVQPTVRPGGTITSYI